MDMNDVLGKEIKRMDFVRKGDTTYLVTLQNGLHLWDYEAWLVGYYDAYIPLYEYEDGELEIIGNLTTDPDLLPKECEDYNGEPHCELIETIWTNPKFNPPHLEGE